MLEIKRLANMLKEAGIPFEYRGVPRKPRRHEYFKYQIIYKGIECERLTMLDLASYIVPGIVCSVIQGRTTCGGLENRLEIMGLLTEEEAENDSVCGWLTAEDVFQRIKAHWEKVKG